MHRDTLRHTSITPTATAVAAASGSSCSAPAAAFHLLSLNTPAFPGISTTQQHRAGQSIGGTHTAHTDMSLHRIGLTYPKTAMDLACSCPAAERGSPPGRRQSPARSSHALTLQQVQFPPTRVGKLFYRKQANIHSMEHALKRNQRLL